LPIIGVLGGLGVTLVFDLTMSTSFCGLNYAAFVCIVLMHSWEVLLVASRFYRVTWKYFHVA